MNYDTISYRANFARKIIAEVDPSAMIDYTRNEFGKKLCNGLFVDDCQRISRALASEYDSDSREFAAISREIPLFVFAALRIEQQREFVRRWCAVLTESA